MESKFNSKLFKKEINIEAKSSILGGDFSNSGGTESSSSNYGGDTNIFTYNDNCEVSAITFICHQ